MANDAPQTGFRFQHGTRTLDKADLGTKRVCPSCGARFYDLSKRPIECPKCAFTFEPEAIFKQRRTRQPDAEDKTVDTEETEQENETENEEGIVETIEDEPELATGEDDEDTVHHDEPGHPDSGMSVVDADDVSIDDLDDDAVDEDDGDDALLEPDEGDEDDVSGIIDADIEKDER